MRSDKQNSVNVTPLLEIRGAWSCGFEFETLMEVLVGVVYLNGLVR